MSDEANGVDNAASCCKEAVQFRASIVTSLVLPVFDEICEMGIEFCIFSSG